MVRAAPIQNRGPADELLIMMNPKDAKLVPSDTWLQRVATEEETVASISVGGLVTRLGMYPKIDESALNEIRQAINRRD